MVDILGNDVIENKRFSDRLTQIVVRLVLEIDVSEDLNC